MNDAVKKSPINVLLVEDDARVTRFLLDYFAGREGFRIENAGDGATALDLLDKGEVDVLLLDVQLPGMSGMELLERLAAPPYVIFITGRPDYAVQAFEFGAIDYLVKPFTIERLERALNRFSEYSARPGFSEPLPDKKPRDVDSSRSYLSGLDTNALGADLLRLMEEQGLYRDEKLNQPTLAAKLGITPHQLSELLNNKYKRNFNGFVNEFRVKEACEILLREPERTILSIALEVGFGSKSTFNRVFSREKGISPENFRK